MLKSFNIYQYWGQGKEKMPPFIKTIYQNNLEICKKYNINLILIDDENVYNYITPHPRFKNLAYNHKSDLVRYYILHKYGGFWFDTDIILIKNLNLLYEEINKYEMMLDIEFDNNIGCASLYLKKDSICSNFCVNYINDVLENQKIIEWVDIGPKTVCLLYKKHSSLILLNNYEKVKKGCNFICWNENPGINKQNWFFPTQEDAERKAKFLKENKSCYYLITWTIYRINNMGLNLINTVFKNKQSVFSYFINNNITENLDKIIVKNSPQDEWNGVYYESTIKFCDKNTKSYAKDNTHHLYSYKKIWRLGETGVKVYKTLGSTISNEIDISKIHESKNTLSMKNKYVLCCPINGFNDTFNQILKCYNYCLQTGRTLLVNTLVEHNHSMKYNFSDYFYFKDTDFDIICDTNQIIDLFKKNKFSVLHNLNHYLIGKYNTKFIGKEKDGSDILCDLETEIPLKFDFNKNYSEDILIHFQGGGGNEGKLLFNHLIWKRKIVENVNLRINKLSQDYISVYVKNTEKITDYKLLLNKYRNILQNNTIYLVSDDKKVLKYFRDEKIDAYNFTNTKSNNHDLSNLNTDIKILCAFTDLYMMGNSKKIISNYDCGFLNLAKYLYDNKKIIHNILTQEKELICFDKSINNTDSNNFCKKVNYAVMWASTINIGDDIQTLAAINFLNKKGITDYSFIDREKLSEYTGKPVNLIMNGWYMHNISKFPPSDKITPIFISVHINNPNLIANNISYFKKYEPIGCRDLNTVRLFEKYEIKSYFTGCLTLLFDDVLEKDKEKYLVDVNTKCNYIPNIELDTTKYKDFEIIEHDINKIITYDKPLFITFIFDKNYINHFITVVKSIILNEYRNYKNQIIFLINYFGNQEEIEILKNKVKIFGENKFYFKNIPEEYPEICEKIKLNYDLQTAVSQIQTYSVYCRFYLDYIWSEIDDIILYLDLDIIVKHPISLLFDSLDDQNVLFACPNSTIGESIDKSFNKQFNNLTSKIPDSYKKNLDNIGNIDYDLTEKGFNGGVWAVNLKKFRENNYGNKLELCMIIQAKNKIFNHNDQGIMNIVFYQNFKYLDNRWNALDYGGSYSWATRNNILQKLENNYSSFIIHYNGPDKPWNTTKHYYPKCVKLWNYYNNFKTSYYYCFFSNFNLMKRLEIASELLDKYRKAALVITTRLHCILPCRAFNTQAIFMHKNYQNDPRFQGLHKVINGDTGLNDNKQGDREYIEEIRKNFLSIDI